MKYYGNQKSNFISFFLWFLILVYFIIIFIFSNQSGFVSNDISKSLLRFVYNILGLNLKTLEYTNLIFRKLLHFTEYMFFSILFYKALTLSTNWEKNKLIVLAIVLCAICASFDEIHQIFIPGRTPKLLDIIIDTSGAGLGGIIMLYKADSRIKTS